MDRLTRKTNGKDYYSHCIYIEKTNELFGRDEMLLEPKEYYKEEPYKIEDNYYNEDVLVKLGKLEDLQEELGCPLEIFVNIMLGKRPIIVVNYGDAGGYEPLYEELTETTADGIIDGCNYYCLCIETNLCEIPVKDYGKNWWLKGEK